MRTLDYELLFLYSNNCRENISVLSSYLKKSSQRIFYNIERFEEEKIIEGHYLLIDYSLFDLLLFRVYFRGGHSSESRFSEIIDALKKNSYVTSIFEFEGGEYDFYIEMMTRNPSRFNKELKNIIKEYSELNNYMVMINIVTHVFDRKVRSSQNKKFKGNKRNFDIQNRIDPDIVIGGDKLPITFTKKDMTIIKSLFNNPIAKYTAIASETGYNIKTVIESMKKFGEDKIIRSYLGVINLQKVNLIRNKIILKLHNINPEEEKKLIDFCNGKDEIIQVNKLIGSWDIEIDVETFTVAEFRDIYLYIREYFKEIIKEFNSYQFYKVHLKKYLPDEIFKEMELLNN